MRVMIIRRDSFGAQEVDRCADLALGIDTAGRLAQQYVSVIASAMFCYDESVWQELAERSEVTYAVYPVRGGKRDPLWELTLHAAEFLIVRLLCRGHRQSPVVGGGMRVACSWCHKELRVDQSDEVSHGICDACVEGIYMKLFPVGASVTYKGRRAEVLKHLETRTVILVDGNGAADVDPSWDQLVVRPSELEQEQSCQ